MRCYCLLDNVSRVDGKGADPCRLTHGTDLKGNLVPVGANVFFKSTAERVRKLKYEEPAITRVIAGYNTTTGYGWSGIYLVWKLERLCRSGLAMRVSCCE